MPIQAPLTAYRGRTRLRPASALPLVLAVAVLAGLTAISPEARADSAAAQALFDAAVKLRESGDTKAACDKFEESLRLDAAVGTRFHLADCHERVGRLASAWATFTAVADESERDGESKRAAVARARADKLKPRLAQITIDVPTPVPGLSIMRDDVDVGDAQWGIPVPIDSDTYRLSASAPGYLPWQREITIKDGQRFTAVVPSLQKAPDAPKSTTPTEGGLNGVGVTGLVVGGVGLAALGVGAAFGAVAFSKKSEVDTLCPDLTVCTPEGIAANEDGKQAATISTVGLIAGGALLTTGIILLVAGIDGGDEPANETGMTVWPVFSAEATPDGLAGAFVGLSGHF